MLQAGRQAGTHWFSPWEHVLAEGVWLGWCLCHGTAQRSPLVTSLQQTKLLPPSHCHGWTCEDGVPVPLLALHCACCQGSVGSSGATVIPVSDSWCRLPSCPAAHEDKRGKLTTEVC